jgi:hypothetical protein
VLGSLDDPEILTRCAREADAVIDTADANHRACAEAPNSCAAGLLSRLARRRPFIASLRAHPSPLRCV